MKTKENTIEHDIQRITVSVRIPRYLKIYCDKSGLSISHIVEKELIKSYVYEMLKPKYIKKEKVLK